MHTAVCDAVSFIPAMKTAECYPHAAPDIVALETHISWVFLAGAYAYKIKKPVDLGFVDFSSLERRRHFCEEELRLNRRLAPQLYIDVAEIRGAPDAPRIGGEGPILDYAVRMHRFPQEALAKHLLARSKLTPGLVTELARRIAHFHETLPPAMREPSYGAPESVLAAALQNFDQIEPLLADPNDRLALRVVRDWTEREFIETRHHMELRRLGGMVREGHGDLHLGNIVLLEGALVPFDCLEFSPELRWNDVMSEVAFLAMDFLDRGAPRLAWLFLNEYLDACGAYSGLSVLRFYMAYRAMVRAKVHLLRASQPRLQAGEASRLLKAYRSYVALALERTKRRTPALVLMHGYSGSGKSTVALELVQSLGAIRVRSDVERKRLAGIAPLEHGGAAIGQGLYGTAATAATYERLAAAARAALEAGYTAVVDAAFLKRWQRDAMQSLARSVGVRILVLDVRAPECTLEQRVAARRASASDPSDAGLEVLRHQIATAEPIAKSEGLDIIAVDGAASLPEAVVTQLQAQNARRSMAHH